MVKYDSYGHSEVLQGLVTGTLFDFGRLPFLTILAAAGFVLCLIRWKEKRYLIPVAIFVLWLLLFFGRATWGPLIDVLPMSRYLHMNRFIAGVHMGGILLMAVSLALGGFSTTNLVCRRGDCLGHIGIVASLYRKTVLPGGERLCHSCY